MEMIFQSPVSNSTLFAVWPGSKRLAQALACVHITGGEWQAPKGVTVAGLTAQGISRTQPIVVGLTLVTLGSFHVFLTQTLASYSPQGRI